MHYTLWIVVMVGALAVAWRYLGSYMVAVYNGRLQFMGWLERPTYRILGVDPDREQTWQRYAASLVVYSGVAVGVTYLIIRVQGHLPLNPQHLGGVTPALGFNTAVSFVTNTNWQNYSGESTMSYLSQMGSLTVQQFVSASAGLAVMIALIRGFARKPSAPARDATAKGTTTIGNFWVDLIRGVYYILLPIALVAGVVFVAQGAVQTFAGPVAVRDVLNGFTQIIPRGPVASMEVIKQLGNNGGGFFNANGAHPFEDPTALTMFLSVFLLLLIPVASTYTFGKMVGSVRQGIAVLATMMVLFGSWLAFANYAEHVGNPAVAAAGIAHQPEGNMVGHEVRFGGPETTFYDVASTQTSTGSVAANNDSFTAIGGMSLLTGMMLGEVSPGGAGAGMYTILAFAVIAVFIGGLMVGRTPEYLGKKIQSREIKLSALLVLVMPMLVLIMTGISIAIHAGYSSIDNAGPHGFSEVLYSFTSQANNNGSGFAGLASNTPYYNVMGAIAMWVGRMAQMVPALALAGVLAQKQVVPEGAGTFRTDTPLFVGLFVGTIVIVGALTFFPAVALGPIVEQLLHHRFF